MANVIRKDVISIDFDVNDGNFSKLIKMTDNFKNMMSSFDSSGFDDVSKCARQAEDAMKGLGDVAKNAQEGLSTGIDTAGFDSIKNNAEQTKEAIKALEEGVKSAKESAGFFYESMKRAAAVDYGLDFSGIAGDIEIFDARIEVLKDNFTAIKEKAANFKNTVKGIASHPIQSLSNALSSVKVNAAAAVINFEHMARQKLSNLTGSIKDVYSTLSRGQTGAKGFVTALKSIGKVGFEKTISRFENIKKSVKNITFDKLKNSIKTISFDKIKSGLNNVWNGAKKLSSGLKQAASVSFETLKKSISGLKSVMSSVSSAAEKMKGSISSAASGITSKVFNLKNLVAGVATGAVVQKSIDIVVDRQDITSQFEVLLGSAEKAQERVNELTDFAGMTPFTRDEIFAASKQLQVFTGDALSTGDSLRVIGDVAAGTGRAFEDVALCTGRLYDAMKSGNAVGDMTSQLQEMGAISGEDREKIEKLSEAGGDIAKKWKDVEKIFSRYDGTMEKLSNNLGNLLTSLKSFATNSIFYPLGQGITRGLQPAIEKFREFRKTNKADVDAMGEVIHNFAANICVPLFDKIEQGAEFVVKAIGSLKDGISGLNNLKGTSPILDNIVDAISFICENKDVVISALEGIASVASGILIADEINGIGETLASLASPLGLTVALAELMFMIFKDGKSSVDSFFNGLSQKAFSIISEVSEMLNTTVNNIIQLLPEAMDSFVNIISNIAEEITKPLPGLVSGISGILSSLSQGISENFPTLLNVVLDVLNAVIDSISSNIGMILNSAIEIASSLISGIAGALPQVVKAGIHLLIGLVRGIMNALPNLIAVIPVLIDELLNSLMQSIPMLIRAGITLVTVLANGIIQNMPAIEQAAIDIMDSIFNVLTEYLPIILQSGTRLVMSLISGMAESLPENE